MRYCRRLPREFQVVLVRDCVAKDRALITDQAYKDWSAIHSDVSI
jgi:hypothetical protein